jgi:hypothetical protein
MEPEEQPIEEAREFAREALGLPEEATAPAQAPDPATGPLPRRMLAPRRPGLPNDERADRYVRHKAKTKKLLQESLASAEPAGEPAPALEGPSPAEVRAWENLEAATEEVLRTGDKVVQPMQQKVMAIKVAMDLFARPRPEAEERLASLPLDAQPLIRALIGRAATSPKLARQMQVAVFQYGDAQRALEALKERLKRARELSPPASTAFLETLPLPKVRGKYYVLTNFNVTFRGDPLLGKLFPPRVQAKKTAPGVEGSLQTGQLQGGAPTGPIQEPGGFWNTMRDKLIQGRNKPRSDA